MGAGGGDRRRRGDWGRPQGEAGRSPKWPGGGRPPRAAPPPRRGAGGTVPSAPDPRPQAGLREGRPLQGKLLGVVQLALDDQDAARQVPAPGLKGTLGEPGAGGRGRLRRRPHPVRPRRPRARRPRHSPVRALKIRTWRRPPNSWPSPAPSPGPRPGPGLPGTGTATGPAVRRWGCAPGCRPGR